MFLAQILDLSTALPVWAVLLVFLLGLSLPFAIRWARGHDHPELAEDLEKAEKVIAFLADAITKADHSGSVAAHVEQHAQKHDLDEHPAVVKITS